MSSFLIFLIDNNFEVCIWLIDDGIAAKLIIWIIPTTSKKPALFKINKCFLENLTTDFTTSGQPAFFQDSGTPVTTTLGLTFKETVLVTRNSIGEGY